MRMTQLIHCLGIVFFSVLIFAVHGAPTKPKRITVTILNKDLNPDTERGKTTRITHAIMKMFHSKPDQIGYKTVNGIKKEEEGGGNKNTPMVCVELVDSEGEYCKDHPCYAWTERKNGYGTFGSFYSFMDEITDKDGHRTVMWRRHRLDPSPSSNTLDKGDVMHKSFLKDFEEKKGITAVIKEIVGIDPDEQPEGGQKRKPEKDIDEERKKTVAGHVTQEDSSRNHGGPSVPLPPFSAARHDDDDGVNVARVPTPPIVKAMHPHLGDPFMGSTGPKKPKKQRNSR